MRVFDHPFRGLEFDWFALDHNGRPGLFSTAGEGWVPRGVMELISGLPDQGRPDPTGNEWISPDVLELLEKYRPPEEFISGLPDRGEPVVLYRGKGVITDWIKVATKGIYAFDWNRSTDRYELVAKPTERLPHAEFGEVLAARFYRVILEGSFDEGFFK